MKKLLIFLVALVLITTLSLLANNSKYFFYRGTFISAKEAQKRLGKIDIDLIKWKTASIADRAKMASSIVINKKGFIGKTNLEIKQIFGENDSYYVNDPVPAYVIQENTPSGGERWDLVFLIDKDNNVFDIKIHRQYP